MNIASKISIGMTSTFRKKDTQLHLLKIKKKKKLKRCFYETKVSDCELKSESFYPTKLGVFTFF